MQGQLIEVLLVLGGEPVGFFRGHHRPSDCSDGPVDTSSVAAPLLHGAPDVLRYLGLVVNHFLRELLEGLEDLAVVVSVVALESFSFLPMKASECADC